MSDKACAPLDADPSRSCSASSSLDSDDIRMMTHIALGVDSALVPMCVIVDGVNHIKMDITAIAGGVSVLWGAGTWVQGSEHWRSDDPRGEDAITGSTIEETVTANFLLTLTIEEQRRLWPDIRTVIREGVTAYRLHAEYIHCMTWQVQSNIFTISLPSAPPIFPPTAFSSVVPANDNPKQRGRSWK